MHKHWVLQLYLIEYALSLWFCDGISKNMYYHCGFALGFCITTVVLQWDFEECTFITLVLRLDFKEYALSHVLQWDFIEYELSLGFAMGF